MIVFQQGNLLEAETDAIINTVNCVGVMGKGVALQFKQAYPDNFKAYAKACKAQQVVLGKMFVYSTGQLTPPRYIINFPTKGHWKANSRLDDIRHGLDDLVTVIQKHSIESIAMPALGCGNGGLDWSDVLPLIEATFAKLPNVKLVLFAPQPAPTAKSMPVATKKPNMTIGRALVIKLMAIYKEPGYELTKLEIQKLAYFCHLQKLLPKLNYQRDQFGPYADNLNHVLTDIEGHYIRGYGDRTNKSSMSIINGALDAANALIHEKADQAVGLDRVTDLIYGFENPYGLELLSSLLWIANESDVPLTEEQAIQQLHEWNPRKKSLFPEKHIVKAWRHLIDQGWVKTAA